VRRNGRGQIPPTSTDRGEAEGRDGTIAAEMNDHAAQLERRDGVLDVTVYHGFFKSDTPHVGMHVLVTTDAEVGAAGRCNVGLQGEEEEGGARPSLAQRTACEMAEWVWTRRQRFRQRNLTPVDAVRTARELLVAAPVRRPLRPLWRTC
jgi:microcystin degradation protein MlrC